MTQLGQQRDAPEHVECGTCGRLYPVAEGCPYCAARGLAVCRCWPAVRLRSYLTRWTCAKCGKLIASEPEGAPTGGAPA